MAEFSDDELMGDGYAASLPDVTYAKTGPRREFNDEELAKTYLPPEERGILSNSPDDGWVSSALKSAGTIGQGVVAGTAGMFGEALNFGDMIGAYISSKIDPSKSMGERMRESKETYDSVFPWLPDYADVKGTISNTGVGDYRPTSAPGRAAQTGFEALGTALVPGSAEQKAAPVVKRLLEEGLPAFLGGSTAQVVGEQTDDPLLAVLSGLGAGLTSRVGVGVAKNWRAPEETAQRVAGQVIREQADDPASAKTNLNSFTPGDYLPGLPVRAGTVSQDPGLMSLDVLLGRDSRFMHQDTEAARLASIVSGDPARANTVVAKGAAEVPNKVPTDVAGSYGLNSAAPRQTSSEAVRTIYSNFEESAAKKMEDAWKDPRIASANMYKNKVLDSIDSYINGLSATRRKLIPQDVIDTVEQLRGRDGKTIPLTELQDIRSRVLSEGRKLFKTGDNFGGGENNAFARHLSDVLNDGSNIMFGDKPKILPGASAGSATGTARQAWQKAVDATRDYYQTFNEGFLKDLNAETPGGTLKVAMDRTLDAALDPRHGTQAIEQLQKVTNGAINAPLSDYMIARMTGNGVKVVSPKQVDQWLAQGNNQAVIDKVPGLRARIDAIRNMSVTDQLMDSFARNANDPAKLVELFDSNRQLLNTAVPTAERQYFRMLENSARLVAKDIPDDPGKMKTALRALANGNTSDILFAVGTGRIASVMTGIASTIAAGHLIPDISWLPEVGIGGQTALGTLFGTAHVGNFGVKSAVERALTGHVRQQAMEILQRARRDPELMKVLMSKPTPEVLSHLLSPQGVVGVQVGAEKGVSENRSGFASGGAVGSEEAEAARLMKETDRARSMLGRETESILSKPDDHVVAALDAVKNVI